MATKQKEVETKEPEAPAPVATAVAVVESRDVRDLFSRSINGRGPVRQLALKRVLTRPLVSMSKRKQLAVEVQSEMYLMDLPLTGRGGGTGATRVFDALEIIPGENGFTNGDEIIVTCHEIMCSALSRAGYASMKDQSPVPTATDFVSVSGKPLKGALLGFISGDIAEGKRYRTISVAELE